MARTARPVSRTGIYHVMMRGVNKEAVFAQESDKKVLRHLFYAKKSSLEVVIYSYCIMNNHFHMLMQCPMEDLSKFFHLAVGAYAIYYNKTKDRSGHVFDNRYKSECVEEESYFWNCLRYIHNNPCKAGLTDIPHQYIYSSFQEYLNQKSYILHPKAIQLYSQHFGSEKAFREFHQGNSLNSFLDTQEDLFRQQTEVARMLLRHVTEEEKIPSEENIWLNSKLKKVLRERLIETLGISKDKADSLMKMIVFSETN